MNSQENGLIEESVDKGDGDDYEPDIHFEPVIKLPLVEKVTLEEEEDLMTKLRGRLYRFDSSETPSTWKERGTGEIKMLYHPKNNTVRVVMRRDKTLKICANHFITPSMQLLRPNNNRKNWWMWSAGSDFSDEISKAEIFAIKFSTEEDADLWREKFIEGQSKIRIEKCSELYRVKNADSANSSEADSSTDDENESGSESTEKSRDSDDEHESDSKSKETCENTEESLVTNTTDTLSDSVSKLDVTK